MFVKDIFKISGDVNITCLFKIIAEMPPNECNVLDVGRPRMRFLNFFGVKQNNRQIL